MTSLQLIEESIERISRERLQLQTLHPRGRDDLDVHDLAVWTIRDALRAAYIAGEIGRFR